MENLKGLNALSIVLIFAIMYLSTIFIMILYSWVPSICSFIQEKCKSLKKKSIYEIEWKDGWDK